MRNIHPGTCYRCGEQVYPGTGHFEKVSKVQRKKWPDLGLRTAWLLQHAYCAIKYRGTDTHYQIKPALPSEGDLRDSE